MKKWALGIALVGIAVLLVIVFSPNAERIDSLAALRETTVTSKVRVEGVVSGERAFPEYRIMNVGGIPTVCSCSGIPLLDGKEVKLVGVVEEYQDSRQVRALEVVVLE